MWSSEISPLDRGKNWRSRGCGVDNVWRHLWWSWLGWGRVLLHPVGGSQGCCLTSDSAEDTAHSKEVPGPWERPEVSGGVAGPEGRQRGQAVVGETEEKGLSRGVVVGRAADCSCLRRTLRGGWPCSPPGPRKVLRHTSVTRGRPGYCPGVQK